MPDSINKIATEAQSKLKRQKIVILPVTEDIRRLVHYLKVERKRCFQVLEHYFNLSEWLNGLKLVAAYLLVFNRRRVGDIQNILLSDLNRIECISKKNDHEEFNLLDDIGKKIAEKFFKIEVRGKRDRTVSVIAGADVIKEINLLIRHRISVNVPATNEYLFGLPNKVDDRIRVINICKEMRSFSVLCGAEKPELLRGTGLRKHVATKCIELELNDNALGDVMKHMGHSEKIHREIYQQPIKSKTIVGVAKVLEAVQGPVDMDEEENEMDDVSDFIVIPSEAAEKESDNKSDEPVFVSQPSCSHDINTSVEEDNLNDSSGPSTRENLDIQLNLDYGNQMVLNSVSNDNDNKKICRKTSEITETIQKKRWTKTEVDIVTSAFKYNLESGTLPSLEDIDDLQEKYPCMMARSRESIKTWVWTKNNSKKQPDKLRVIKNQPVRFNLKKLIKKSNLLPSSA
ncbi:uncharacterized protein LOC141532219 [Cotesia typhae]|uniref:uncharacterized protein LOC141532219 n=1 Tax=Cotesia typhae TaxID=2053667 RepID=UPI003D68EC6D